MNNTAKFGALTLYKVLLGYHNLSSIIPANIWVKAGRWLGLLVYLLDFRHRKIVLKNLRFAFGKEKGEKELHLLTRKNFQQFGMIGQEWIRLKHFSKNNRYKLNRLLSFQGLRHLTAAKKKNAAVIFLGAHFGNWEYAHLYYASQINRLNFIVRRVDNPFIEQERVAYNNHFGVNILYKESGLRSALRRLKKGEDLVVFADQRANLKEGIPCQFFGKNTSTLPIISVLAQKYRIPVVPMFAVRTPDMLHHRIIFLPEIKIEYDNPEFTALKITQELNDVIEQIIRRYPEQWLWFHRKWNADYPELYN